MPFCNEKLNKQGKALLNHGEEQEPKINLDLKTQYEELKAAAQEEASKIILEAQKQAEQIIIESQQQMDNIWEQARQEGYSQGYDEGFREGQNQGATQYQSRLDEAEGLKIQYITQKENLYKDCEQDMVKLAVYIARKVIENKIAEDDGTYLKIAEKALKAVQGQKKVQLKVSSRDYEKVLQGKDYLISQLNGVEDIEVIEDEFLKRGSCIIDTGSGMVDGGVDSQMEQIEAVFETLLKNIA